MTTQCVKQCEAEQRPTHTIEKMGERGSIQTEPTGAEELFRVGKLAKTEAAQSDLAYEGCTCVQKTEVEDQKERVSKGWQEAASGREHWNYQSV